MQRTALAISIIPTLAITGCNDSDDPLAPPLPTPSEIVLDFPTRVANGSAGQVESRLADLTGDGIDDLVTIDLLDDELRVARGLGGNTFLPPEGLTTAGRPLTLTTGDFDGDGIDEVAVATTLDAGFEENTLDGLDGDFRSFVGSTASLQMFELDTVEDLFVEASNNALPGAVLQLSTGNFGDAVDTVLVPSTATQEILLYRLDEFGMRPVAALPSTGIDEQGTPVSAIALDANGDGLTDVLGGEADFDGDGPGFVSLYLQDEKGGFGAPQFGLAAPLVPLVVRVGDVNGDGQDDAAGLDVGVGASEFFLYATQGDALADFGTFTAGGRTSGVAVADFVDTGAVGPEVVAVRLDEAVALTFASDTSLLSSAPIAAGFVPRGATVLDAAGKGATDELAIHHATGTSFLPGSPDGLRGTLGYPVAVSSQFLRSADLDGDGFGDVVTLDLFQRQLTILAGSESAGLTVAATLELEPTASQIPGSFEFGDMDGDGDTDIVVALFEADEVRILVNGGGSLTDPEAPAFGSEVVAVPVGSGPLGIEVGDLDGDGTQDLVVGNSIDRTLQVLQGLGELAFTTASLTELSARPLAIDLGDIDGVGGLELAMTTDQGDGFSPGLMVLDGETAFDFEAVSSLALLHPAGDLELAQLDEDTPLEIVVSQPGVASSTLVVADAATGDLSTFGQIAVEVIVENSDDFDPATFVVGDVDADGDEDIVAIAASGRPILLENGGALEFGIAAFPNGVANGSVPFGTRHARIANVDGDAAPELLLLAPSRPWVWVVDGVDPATETDAGTDV